MPTVKNEVKDWCPILRVSEATVLKVSAGLVLEMIAHHDFSHLVVTIFDVESDHAEAVWTREVLLHILVISLDELSVTLEVQHQGICFIANLILAVKGGWHHLHVKAFF